MAYFRIEIVSEGGYTDPRSPVGDAPHGNTRRKVQAEEEGVELGKGSPQRVSDLDNG